MTHTYAAIEHTFTIDNNYFAYFTSLSITGTLTLQRIIENNIIDDFDKKRIR